MVTYRFYEGDRGTFLTQMPPPLSAVGAQLSTHDDGSTLGPVGRDVTPHPNECHALYLPFNAPTGAPSSVKGGLYRSSPQCSIHPRSTARAMVAR